MSTHHFAAVRAAAAQLKASAAEAPPWMGYVWAAASSMGVSLVAMPLLASVDLTDIAMLFMLGVVLIAARFGRHPAMLASVLNVLAFDFFFVPPHFSFAVDNTRYLLTFAIMIVVGLLVGQLTAALRLQARAAESREKRTRIHYEMAQALGEATSEREALEIGCRTIKAAFNAKTAILLPDESLRLLVMDLQGEHLPSVDMALAKFAFDTSQPVGSGTGVCPSNAQLYVPLRAAGRNEGVLVIDWMDSRTATAEQRRLLHTFSALMSSAAARLHLLSVAQAAQFAADSEQLRNSILGALSHDLRTPLTAVIGLSEVLGHSLVREESSQVRQAVAITERLIGIFALVSNLLDMARFESGAVALRREWQSVEEIAESAVRSIEDLLSRHTVALRVPETLPLVYADAVLLERVFANLFENAAKYSDAATTISLDARREEDLIIIEVSDEGPGMPAGNVEALFQKFTRGEKESSKSGVGLGLSICRAIVQAHGGTIRARNKIDVAHGTVVTWTIPHLDSPVFNEAALEISATPCVFRP